MYLQPLPQNETNTETYSNWQNEGISTCIKWSYHVLIKFVMCLNFWTPEAFCPTIRIIVYHKSCLLFVTLSHRQITDYTFCYLFWNATLFDIWSDADPISGLFLIINVWECHVVHKIKYVHHAISFINFSFCLSYMIYL